MQFSKCDQWLVSVSRDRCVGVWQRNTETNLFEKRTIQSVHSRLIFCANFTHDSKFIITGSRDKSIKIWKLVPEAEGDAVIENMLQKKFKTPVTAVTFARDFLSEENKAAELYTLWIGFETGLIECYTFNGATGELNLLGSVNKNHTHSKRINRIVIGPQGANGGVLVASCSDDHSTRLYEYMI